MYPITQNLIRKNRTFELFSPQGWVVHSTATLGATDENEQAYFDNNAVQASANYFVDWDSITRTVPENERSMHAGYTANHKYISVEMCEPKDDDPDRFRKFQETWNRTVWLVADGCVRHNWNIEDGVNSHYGITMTYHETDHIDPYPYFAKYGKTWKDFLNAVREEMDRIKGGDYEMDVVVVYFSPADYSEALIIANENGNCLTQCRMSQSTVHPDVMKAKKVFNIGGPKIGHPNEVYLSGASAKETLIAVADELRKK